MIVQPEYRDLVSCNDSETPKKKEAKKRGSAVTTFTVLVTACQAICVTVSTGTTLEVQCLGCLSIVLVALFALIRALIRDLRCGRQERRSPNRRRKPPQMEPPVPRRPSPKLPSPALEESREPKPTRQRKGAKGSGRQKQPPKKGARSQPGR